MVEVILASRNKGKIREIRELLGDLKIHLTSLDDHPGLPSPVEDGESFRENAVKKAKVVASLTRKIAIADDSGLEVEALDGKPGVRSARFGGEGLSDEGRAEKLLSLLKDIPSSNRKAAFKCVVAIVDPQGNVRTTKGKCSGIIGFEPKGENGFGYDPIFIPEEYEKTMAELSPEIKNKISHRAKAFAQAKKILEEMIAKQNTESRAQSTETF
ncbi:XTP/dITP diphosphatase [bacterium]|nr:XTP/dITP diphosphatase [bacterium]MBU1615610.1 XTP/dITP diphosphatase [bacterium]